ncbi:MAG: glycosyltransferase [Pirellulales bacterium]|nr:glycosyltransferase [Pirellulales bacterium]
MELDLCKTSVRAYYDSFVRKLLADYWGDNPRTAAALRHALRWIPEDARRILDVGCGLGWSTRELADHFPRAAILGVDLSPQLSDVARRLTTQGNVRFQAGDFTAGIENNDARYDAAVLIDVYEHFPAADRPKVHGALARLLTDQALVILTFPTPRHQAMLRSRYPDRLQPVDEDVTFDDLQRLARDLGGETAFYREVDIWQKGDYGHAVIARGSNRVKPLQSIPSSSVQIESRIERQRRIKSRLQVEVYAGGLIVPARTGKTLCIATPSVAAASETFITNHIVHLPFRVCLLHGKWLQRDHQGKPVASPIAYRLADPLLGRLRIARSSPWLVRGTMRFFRRENVAAVLAEYGPTGVRILPACRKAGVPLIVHFHGYDAYRQKVIDRNRSQYQQLFEYAGAVIAVSRDMEEQLARLGAPQEKIVYIPCGVDTTQFEGAEPAKSPPQFLAVGRFVEKKGPLITLSAFAKVLRQCPEATLTMIGDGPLLDPAKDLARSLGISTAVQFPGSQPHHAVRAAMQKARALVQHSLRAADGDSEGTPVAVMEAQASGLPVVATRHAGIKDVVQDGGSGLLVAEKDQDALAEAMITLALDADLAARLGRVGRQRVAAEFNLPLSIERLTSVIHRLS